jgi:hypothetical protein
MMKPILLLMKLFLMLMNLFLMMSWKVVDADEELADAEALKSEEMVVNPDVIVKKIYIIL